MMTLFDENTKKDKKIGNSSADSETLYKFKRTDEGGQQLKTTSKKNIIVIILVMMAGRHIHQSVNSTAHLYSRSSRSASLTTKCI